MNNMTQEKCYSCGGKGTYSQMHGIHGAEDFGADGFDLPPGIHNYPCKACDGTGLKKVMTQDWKELRDDWMMYHAELYQPGSPINTMTIFDWWMNKLKEQRLAVLSEERQFVLNVLDGIDIADAQMGIVGGTQAIRQALESRIIKHE